MELTRENLIAILIAVGVAFAVFVVLVWLRRLVRNRLQKMQATTKVEFLERPLGVLSHTSLLFFVVLALFAGLQTLDLGAKPEKVLDSLVTIALFWQAGLWLVAAMTLWLEGKRARSAGQNLAAASSLGIISFIVQAVIWTVVLLLTLENLGVRVTALVAGLGVGGVAVALAVQNVLGDLLASLSISFDRPFVLGDFLVMDDILGSVEYIGVKTTRLRALSGEQIIMSNADLLKSRIHNYGRMAERRVQFNFWVTFDTPIEAVEALPAQVRSIVEAQKSVRFDRAHFSKYAESGLEYEVVYYVLSADYNLYMDIQQTINIAILRQVANVGAQFATPASMVYLPNNSPLLQLAQARVSVAGAAGRSPRDDSREGMHQATTEAPLQERHG